MEPSSKLLVFFLFFLFALIANAQDSPQDYVNAHNKARSQVGGSNIAYSQNYANQCKGDCRLVHSGGKYGENLARSSGDLSGVAAVKMWVDEKPNYDYNSNSCVGRQCGHYTQVVWKSSVRVRCDKVRCNNRGTFIGCNYDHAGHIIGQRPYS